MLFGRFVKLFDPEQDIEIICNDEVVDRGKAKNFYKNGLTAWLVIKEGCIKAEGDVIRFYC